ncbi:odorant receptor 74a-like [Eurosta solidaginis]|uniref:odorant receptor 74a-like n=1 Tax=Eurosta solidaginis TaxID=178769 RepID=UPI0035309D6D
MKSRSLNRLLLLLMRYLPSGYHKPKLPNGQYPPIDWQLYCFFGSCCWPLAENVSKTHLIIELIIILFQFISECMVSYGEFLGVLASGDDMSFACIALAPLLILLEMMLRTYNMIFKRNGFRKHWDEFYKRIYVEKSWQPELFEQIRRLQLPTKYSTFTYIMTLVTYIYVPVRGLLEGERLLPFPSAYKFDYAASWLRYFTLLAMYIWTGIAVVGPLVAESNMLAMQVLHLNARYLLLLSDLRKISKEAIAAHNAHTEEDNIPLTQRFRLALVDIIRRNLELNNFAESLQSQYSFRIFIMMALSATLLCVLGFLTATLGFTTTNIRFTCWIIGKIVELLIFGRLGTTLSTTTNDLSTSYYCCEWEDIIFHSTDSKENAKIMKLMALAIHLNSNPFKLSGLNFFYVNYTVVVSILKGAGSYFTVIYAYR